MIMALLVFFYVTFFCKAYGIMLFHLLAKITRSQSPFPQSFIVSCLSGLAFVAVLFTFLSLIIPVGGMMPHLLLTLLPLLYWLLYKKKYVSLSLLASLKGKILYYPISVIILLFSSSLLVLVMHASAINHPDTLIYHAQNIQWIEKYRAIPGIVNLFTNYGIQSSWFILCALFSFSFTGSTALTFINATVLIWFFIFIAQKIAFYLQEKEKNILSGFLWLILLIVCFASYTQVRLTATSASPDFIVVLYSWLIIYLFVGFESNRNLSFYLLLIFLSFFSVTIKLTAFPLLLLTIYAYYKYNLNRNLFQLTLPAITGLVILFPFLARNVISTGYLFFPFPYPDIFTVDWKAPKNVLVHTQQYIKAYARTNASSNMEEIKSVIKMKIGDWLPYWWSLRSLVDKIIIASMPLLAVAAILFKRKSLSKQTSYTLTGLFFLITGILFWFTQAPDPRFGFGFLIPASGLLIYLLAGNIENKLFVNKRWLTCSLLLFSTMLTFYSTYRLANYFAPKNILLPSGVPNSPYNTITCKGININLPFKNSNCGSIPVPCSQDSCTFFIPRGEDIQYGFKRKQPFNY